MFFVSKINIVPDFDALLEKSIFMNYNTSFQLVLELCSKESPADLHILQAHLQRIQNLLSLNKELEVRPVIQ